MRNFIGIYQRGEQHLFPKFKNNDKYIKSIREFLDTCQDTEGRKLLHGLTLQLEKLL